MLSFVNSVKVLPNSICLDKNGEPVNIVSQKVSEPLVQMPRYHQRKIFFCGFSHADKVSFIVNYELSVAAIQGLYKEMQHVPKWKVWWHRVFYKFYKPYAELKERVRTNILSQEAKVIVYPYGCYDYYQTLTPEVILKAIDKEIHAIVTGLWDQSDLQPTMDGAVMRASLLDMLQKAVTLINEAGVNLYLVDDKVSYFLGPSNYRLQKPLVKAGFEGKVTVDSCRTISV